MPRVRTIYLDRLVRDVSRAAGAMPADLRSVIEDIATGVALDAQSRARGLGGVHRHVASGIVASGQGIDLRTNDQPAILGAEFGGGSRPRTRQFPPYRGSGAEAGYMLYPTLREFDIEDRVDALLDDWFSEV